MKAVLVIDMPDSCYECQFQGMGGRNLELLTCSLNRWCVDNPNERPSWCPLKPLPDCPDVPDTIANDVAYIIGWNDCVVEILKNEKKQKR